MADQVVTVVEDSISIIESATQGPTGPPGPVGSPYLTLTADGPLSGRRVVRSTTGGKAGYADSGTPAHANLVLGITTSAAADGADVFIQLSGLIVEPTWAWAANQTVFCGLNGVLTQTPPTAGFSLVVGVATSPTSLAVDVKQPINLS